MQNPSLRLTSLNFHSLGFFWARQCGMYLEDSNTIPPVPLRTDPVETKTERWKDWAAKQVQLRALLGHYILDGHISRFSRGPTSVRHTANPLPIPASEAAFEAESADQWITEMAKGSMTRSFREVFLALFSNSSSPILENLSSFSIRIILEGLQSTVADIADAKGPVAGMHTKAETYTALIRLYENCIVPQTPQIIEVERSELLIRWHLLGLDLATSSVSLCQNICAYFGIRQDLFRCPLDASSGLNIPSWAENNDSRRALSHAAAIQDIAEKLPLGRSNAVHVPMALFAAATVYAGLCLGGHCNVSIPRKTSWSEIWDENVQAEVTGSISQRPGTPGESINVYEARGQTTVNRNLLYDLTSLKSLMFGSSRWGISSTMDDILQQWISAIHTSTGRDV